MKHPQTLVLLFLITAAFASCSRNQQPSTNLPSASASPPAAEKITSESVVKVSVPSVEVAAGGFADVVVRLTVQNGYHINSNPPTYPYLKATEFDLTDTSDISLNSVSYPKPLVRKFEFADQPLNVYEGEVQLTAVLEAAKTAKKGQQSLPAKLRIQACDERVCYPPGALDVMIPVLIK